jgi:hypothetical protein
MKLYQAPTRPIELELPLPARPTRGIHAEKSLIEIEKKIKEKKDLFSSPTGRKIESTFRGTRNILISGELTQRELDLLNQRVLEQQNLRLRGSNRTVIQKGGVMTGNAARQRIAQKEAQKELEQEKRRVNLVRLTRRRIQKHYNRLGIEARKEGRLRKTRVLELEKLKQFVPIELYKSIPDPEKLITDEDINIQVREALISLPEFIGVSFK